MGGLAVGQRRTGSGSEAGRGGDPARPGKRWMAAELVATSVLIGLVMAIVYGRFALLGVSNVWREDGLNETFPAFYFVNAWIRGFIANPDAGLALWSWNLGLGADVISTLAFHALGDPFSLAGLVFPMASLETAYFVLLLLRVMVAGVLASVYLRRMGARALPAAAGALVYVFTTFTFIAGLRHPFFISAVALLPAMLIGIESALRDGRYRWLTISMFLAAAGNAYFFYVMAIVVVVYGTARFVELTPRGRRWPQILPTAARVAFFSGLGVLLAAPILLPTLSAFLGTWRAQGEQSVPLLYSGPEYGAAYSAAVIPVAARYSTYLGFAVLSAMIVPVVFLRGGNLALKVMLAAFPVFVLVPLIGSVFNGFTFPNNRFVFAWGIFLGLATALVLSDPKPLRRREVGAMGAVYLVLLAPVAGLAVVAGWPPKGALVVPIVVGALTWGLFALESGILRPPTRLQLGGPESDRELRAPRLRWAVVALLVVNIAGNAAHVYGGSDSVLPEYLPAGTVLPRFAANVGSQARALLGGHSGHRVENADRVGWGDALIQDYPGTAFYFSIESGYLTEYQLEHGTAADGFSFRYDGSDDRAALTTLSGVRYYLASEAREEFAPFGFERIGTLKGTSVWQNRHELPIGFVYDAVVSADDYDRLAPAAKQLALLQGALVDGPGVPGVPAIAPSMDVIDVPYTVGRTVRATFDPAARKIVSTGPKASVELAVQPIPDAELYVAIDGFDAVIEGPYIADRRIVTTYSAGGATKSFAWLSRTSPYYWGNRRQVVNLGYRRDGVTHVRIGLEGPGTTTFSSLKVLAVPMADHAARVARLQAAAMQDISLATNLVSGRVASTGGGVLFLSIPYSTGWSADVDGVPAPTLRVNTAFTGVAVEPGEHVVTLRYVTPWLQPGLVLAGVSLVLLLVSAGWRQRTRRRAGRAATSDGTGRPD